MKKIASIFGADFDKVLMAKALRRARIAKKQDEVPVGAIIVDSDGTIISRAHNQVEAYSSQTGHAEHQAIARAGKKRGNWRLEGCWMYVTLEPCAMCMHLILMSRLGGIVYGASSPVFGFHLDKEASLQVYKRDAVQIVPDVCAEESIELLKSFFKKRRKKKKVEDGKKGTR